MESNVSAEESKRIIERDWGKYMMTIWRGDILFFLIDLLFASLVALIVYAIMMIIVWLGQPWATIPAGYIGKAMAMFCIIYVISIAIVAWWRHFIFIIRHAKHTSVNGADEKHEVDHAETGTEQ
jgi:hypothetical protein